MMSSEEYEKVVADRNELDKKLKRVIQAYKSLESEKKALENAISVLCPNSTDEQVESANSLSSANKMDVDQVDSLKKALTTLTVESKRKELAFQSDKKALMRKNEELQAQISLLLKSSGNELHIRDQFIGLKQNNEKIQTDLINEKILCTDLGKKISELSQAMCEKDERINRLELKVQELQRCGSNFTMKVLIDELENIKKSHSEEINKTSNRCIFQSSTIQRQEERIEELEKRIEILTEQGIAAERTSCEHICLLDKLQRQLQHAESENKTLRCGLVDRQICLPNHQVISTQYTSTFVQTEQDYLKNTSKEIEQNQGFNNNLNKSCINCKQYLDDLENLKILLETKENQCNKSDGREKLSFDVVKPHTDADKQNFLKIQVEYKKRVAEIEKEIDRQRTRFLQIVAEKDHEIELIKKKFIFRNQIKDQDPDDPPQSTSSDLKTPDSVVRDVFVFDDKIETMSSKNSEVHRKHSCNLSESKNFFYEQEISKQRNELGDLRNVASILESKLRDVEQSSLVKDIHYLQIIEMLKEEIRVLESKLVLDGGDNQTNMSYLRNIFVQLLSSKSVNDRHRILKAIGTVLQLTSKELKKIEAFNQ